MSANNNLQKEVGELVVEITQVIGDVLVLLIKVLYAIILATFRIVFPKQPKNVKGEIVLITGAGHGIGKELSFLYAAEGATVVVWDINEAAAAQTVKEIAKQGYTKAYSYVCDVTSRDNVLQTAKEVEKNVGEVTILINNAGIMPTHSLEDHTEAEIKKIMDVNVMAHFWTLDAFLPSMKKHNYGHIVSMSSTAGLFGIPNLIPYCTSKFAVRGLMAALSEELRLDKKNEIKLTSIYPFMVNTGLCKRPVIKFRNLMPIVETKHAAEEIMDAQRRDIQDMTIPRYYMGLHNHLNLLPLKAQQYLKDFIEVGLESDL